VSPLLSVIRRIKPYEPNLLLMIHSPCIATRTVRLLFQIHNSKCWKTLSLSQASICYSRKPSHIQVVILSVSFLRYYIPFQESEDYYPPISQLAYADLNSEESKRWGVTSPFGTLRYHICDMPQHISFLIWLMIKLLFP